jgi:hypothetical protein
MTPCLLVICYPSFLEACYIHILGNRRFSSSYQIYIKLAVCPVPKGNTPATILNLQSHNENVGHFVRY